MLYNVYFYLSIYIYFYSYIYFVYYFFHIYFIDFCELGQNTQSCTTFNKRTDLERLLLFTDRAWIQRWCLQRGQRVLYIFQCSSQSVQIIPEFLRDTEGILKCPVAVFRVLFDLVIHAQQLGHLVSQFYAGSNEHHVKRCRAVYQTEYEHLKQFTELTILKIKYFG